MRLNKRVIIIILLVTKITTGWCQSSIEDLIVGKWLAIDPLGDSAILNFDKNKTMFIVSPKGTVGKGEIVAEDGRKIKMLMKYELNLNSKPMHIDFYYYVDNFYNPVAKAEGLIELLDNNTIWLSMNYDKPVSIRPKDFKNPKETSVIFRLNTPNQVKGCENFRNGKFSYVYPVVGAVLIERKDDFQLQTFKNGDKIKFRVDWLDECSYNLTPLENYSSNAWLQDTTGLVMKVRIVKTREKSYIFTGTYNKSKFHFNGEIFKVKN